VKVHSLQLPIQKGSQRWPERSNIPMGWQVYNREIMGEGSCRQNHRPKS